MKKWLKSAWLFFKNAVKQMEKHTLFLATQTILATRIYTVKQGIFLATLSGYFLSSRVRPGQAGTGGQVAGSR